MTTNSINNALTPLWEAGGTNAQGDIYYSGASPYAPTVLHTSGGSSGYVLTLGGSPLVPSWAAASGGLPSGGTANQILTINADGTTREWGLYSQDTGINVSLGYLSLQSIGSGSYNTAVGALSLYGNAAGTNNAGFGYQALYTINGGNDNTAVGYQALFSANGPNSNTAVGSHALAGVSSGSANTAIGFSADVGGNSYSNATCIGAYATAGAGQTLILGGSSPDDGVYYPNVGIGINTPLYSLHIGNTLQVPKAALKLDNTTNTPTSPSSGCAIYSTGNVLKAVNTTSTYPIPMVLPANPGDIMISTDGATWTKLAAPTVAIAKVLTATVTGGVCTLSWGGT